MKKIDDLPKLRGYLSLKEWATLKDVSRAYAHMLVRSGSIKGLRVGEQIVIPEDTEFPVSSALTRQMDKHLKLVARRNSKAVAGLGAKS